MVDGAGQGADPARKNGRGRRPGTMHNPCTTHAQHICQSVHRSRRPPLGRLRHDPDSRRSETGRERAGLASRSAVNHRYRGRRLDNPPVPRLRPGMADASALRASPAREPCVVSAPTLPGRRELQGDAIKPDVLRQTHRALDKVCPKAEPRTENTNRGGVRCVERSEPLRAPWCARARLAGCRCAGPVLVDPGQAGRGNPADARRGSGRLRGRRRLPAVRRRPLADAHPGRARRPARARSACSAALHGSFASMPDDLVDLSGIDLGGEAVNAAYLELGKLGTGEQKYLPWMQATYIMAANKKALRVPAGGRRHQRAHLRPARRLGEGDGRGDRLAEVRLPGRPGGAEAPLLPGLPAALLHRARW